MYFDSADRQRLEETLPRILGPSFARSHGRQIRRMQSSWSSSLLAFANKQDLLNAMSADEIVKALDLQPRANIHSKDRSFQVIACSAKTEEATTPSPSASKKVFNGYLISSGRRTQKSRGPSHPLVAQRSVISFNLCLIFASSNRTSGLQ